MKIYLAGSCSKSQRALMEQIKQSIERIPGTEVYAPWQLKIPNAWDYTQEDWSKLVFDADVAAIKNCSIMVSISQGRRSTAGTNWEQGFAYALGKYIFTFQITDSDTSLMTFCGGTYFVNSSEQTVAKDVYDTLTRFMNGYPIVKPISRTKLT